MKNKRLLISTFLLLCLAILFSGCNITDYQIIVDEAREELKIAGVAEVANRDFTVVDSLTYEFEGKEYVISVSWSSSDTSVISFNGTNATVTRPPASSDATDAHVTVTATLTLEGKTATKEFNLVVYVAEETAEQILAKAKIALDSAMLTLGITSITEDVTLPSRAGLAAVSWVSGNLDAISNSGKINRPINGDGDTTVIMTATLSSAGKTLTAEYSFVIKELPAPADELRAEAAAELLDIPTTNIVDDLELPILGRFGTVVSWTSSDPSIISNTGTVVRPAASGANSVEVILTAHISYTYNVTVDGEEVSKTDTVEKNFAVLVLELEPANDEERISVAYNKLGLNYVCVTSEQLELPVNGLYNSTFTYSSTTPGIIVDGETIRITRSESDDYIAYINVVGKIGETTKSFTLGFIVKSLDGGEGSEQNPFVVETISDLEKVGTGTDGWNLDSHYILYSDIDLSSKYGDGKASFVPIGSREFPFTGTFDGNGFEIKGLYINSETGDRIGLFGVLLNAKISNLFIESPTIIASVRVGALAGQINGGEVYNVHVNNGSIKATVPASDAQTGGLIGIIEPTYYQTTGVKNTVTVNLCSVSNTTVEGQYHVGLMFGRVCNTIMGTVGEMNTVSSAEEANDYGFYVEVANVYAHGTVIGCRRLGGISGSFTGLLENAIADVTITRIENQANSPQFSGLLIGAIEYKSTSMPNTLIKNCLSSGSLDGITGGDAGKRTSFIGNVYNGNERKFFQYENAYTTVVPFSYNGTDLISYADGVTGEQVSMENAYSKAWYTSKMPGFDFENCWTMESDSYPMVQQDKVSALLSGSIGKVINVPDEVTGDLNLITDTNIHGLVVSWTSNNSAITNKGVVTRPSYVDGDLIVTLTASWTIKGQLYSKEFHVVVKALDPTIDEKFADVETDLVSDLGDISSLTDNVNLPTTGKHGATISWSSNNDALSNTGEVTRPVAGSPDATFVLTASITIDGVTRTKEFSGSVKALVSNVLAMEEAISEVVIPDSTITNLTLPTSIETSFGLVVGISWTSNNAAITNSGVVTRPGFLVGDTSVTLTATFTCGDADPIVREYDIVVTKLDATDADYIAIAKEHIYETITTQLTENITLPTLDNNVSAQYIISADGDYLKIENGILTVVRPEYAEGSKTFTITVSLSLNSSTDSFILEVTVIKNLGNGTEDNPFKIAIVADLISGGEGQESWVSDKWYELVADIDMSETYGVGKLSFSPIGVSKAYVKGNNHKIIGLYVNSNTNNGAGLFGGIGNNGNQMLKVYDLTFVNANVNAAQRAGVLAGALRDCVIDNVRIETSAVNGTNANADCLVGGLIGQVDARDNRAPRITNVYVDAIVTSYQHQGTLIGNLTLNYSSEIFISDVELHGIIYGVQRSGSLLGTFDYKTTGTADEGRVHATLKNVVSYVDVKVNPVADLVKRTVNTAAGMIGISDAAANKNFNHVIDNLIYYGTVDIGESGFNINWRASMIGRFEDSADIDNSKLYVACTPFNLNGSDVSSTGVGGTQIVADNLLLATWYQETFTGMDFENVWTMGTNGLVLK